MESQAARLACMYLIDRRICRKQNQRTAMRKYLFAASFLLALSGFAQTEQPALPQRLPFSISEQEAYLDDLIRSAPSNWKHGKNWVLIDPYVLGRNVTQPIARTVCPDPALATPLDDGTEVPPWIYSSSQVCEAMAASHFSAVIELEDRNDKNAGYFLFLACDVKRNRKHCDIQPNGEQDGMDLEESNKGAHRQFDVLALTADELSDKPKISRFFVADAWHMRKPKPQPSPK